MEAHATVVSERLSGSLAQRHWEPAILAQASGVPEEVVRRHLSGETLPETGTLQVYAGVLGLDADDLLAASALCGSTASEPQPSLLAIRRSLDGVWHDATPAERQRLVEEVQRLQDQVEQRRAQGQRP
jgi:hypothetical protein